MPALICGLVRPHGFVPATHAVLEAKARHHSQERGWTSRLHWAASFGASIEAGPGRPGTEPRSSKSIRIASRKSRNRIHCFASNSKCTACSVPSLRSRTLEDQEMIQLVPRRTSFSPHAPTNAHPCCRKCTAFPKLFSVSEGSRVKCRVQCARQDLGLEAHHSVENGAIHFNATPRKSSEVATGSADVPCCSLLRTHAAASLAVPREAVTNGLEC